MTHRIFAERAVATAGWTRDTDRELFRHTDGAEAYGAIGGDGLPVRELLHLSGEWAGRRVSFAIAFDNGRYTPDSWFARIADLALAGPAMMTHGAVVPWLDRLRRETPVWVRDGAGPWWSLGGGTGRRKVAAPDTSTESLVTALLAALVTTPTTAATARAERMLATLRDAGWRDTTARSRKPEPGLRVLAVATHRSQHGVRCRLAYVLTGDPALPEALWWHCDLRLTGWSEGRYRSLLIDVTGAAGPDLPIDREALTDTLAVLLGGIPSLTGASPYWTMLAALRSIATVYRRDWEIDYPVAFGGGLADELPRRDAPPLEQAAAAVRRDPGDGEAWLLVGFAALKARLAHLAVAAFDRAVELGAGGGLPMLWRGWLRQEYDPRAALAELDRAAQVGDVTGLARHAQAKICRHAFDDRDGEIAAYAHATAEDPAYGRGWSSRGLTLAKYGRVAEAVEVLTEATTRHPTNGGLWYYLGYAQMLAGGQESALDSLEQAARLSPELVPAIHQDEDLAPLRGEPRFDGLPTVAAIEETAYHRRAREAVRPAESRPVPGGDRATDLGVVFELRDLRPRSIDRDEVPTGITESGLRELLVEVGIPTGVGTFKPDNKVYSRTLRPYQVGSGYQETPAARLPAGLGGLYVLGKLDEGEDEAAVDGETGEVFRVAASDHSLTYLAPNLTAFLLPLCLPEDEWVWRITPDNLDRLDDVSGIGEGKLALLAEELDKAGQDRLVEFLRANGALLHNLDVHPADLNSVDLIVSCPHLRKLTVRGGTVNESVFAHPMLETLSLRESTYQGSLRDIRLGVDSQMRYLSFEDTLVHADTLFVGPGSPLRSFVNVIDEEYGGSFPEHLEFRDCPTLYKIYIKAGAAAWHLALRGSLPRLETVRQDASPYGLYTYSVDNATPDDRKHYLSLIRKGKDFTNRW